MPRDRARAAYRRLIALYPRSFRERFGESMAQTFDDVRRERRAAGRSMAGFVAWLFAETTLGVARENVARARVARHHRYALAGLLLFAPIGLLLPSLWLDVAVVRDAVTLEGGRPNALGWAAILGGLLLLPVAFVVTLLPMMRMGPNRKRRLYAVNLLVCAVIATPMTATLVGIGEEIYQCEIRGIPNCD